ncbi:MAG TPA: DUF433 domain-containing protein [Tepidisphaeraceae bacterium]|jgi:uncharacterized protein (DUF433 family)|nr:DUF433 domain-containing protein [Tepidisphaeraceae bacterium]
MAYVRTDERGVMRVGDTTVPLESVVYGFQGGDSPEKIVQSYPALSLEQVYGAIAYYLGHREEVDGYLKKLHEEWLRLLAVSEKIPNPARDRIRALLREREQAESRK